MEVTYKCRLLGLSLLLALAVFADTLAWLLHHFPSMKSLDCPLSSLWTILPIDIKSPARSDDVRVMLHLASVLWTFVFFISSSLLFVAFSMRGTSSIPAPQGGVLYRAPLKHVRPSCVHTPSLWVSSLNLGKDGLEGWIVMSSMLNRARRIGQRELLLPCAWKSLISVTCLVFSFSLLWPSLLTCSGRTSVTATQSSFNKICYNLVHVQSNSSLMLTSDRW